jgi:hypothetical protein
LDYVLVTSQVAVDFQLSDGQMDAEFAGMHAALLASTTLSWVIKTGTMRGVAELVFTESF